MKNSTLKPSIYNLTIGWLYPTLMSTYGDRGNIITLSKRCQWRDIGVEVKQLEPGFSTSELQKCDLLFMGGAQDRQQSIVAKDLTKEKVKVLKDMIEADTPGLYICGAYQFLGNYYKEADGTVVDGLGILDLYTENPGPNFPRLIGNILVETHDLISYSYKKNVILSNAKDLDSSGPIAHHNDNFLVGFENHGGRTFLGEKVKPFGKVVVGFGNNGNDQTEGAVYKNSFGTYLHGPILPKNPHMADYLIKLALERKYKKRITLTTLEDSLEWQAHHFITEDLKH